LIAPSLPWKDREAALAVAGVRPAAVVEALAPAQVAAGIRAVI